MKRQVWKIVERKEPKSKDKIGFSYVSCFVMSYVFFLGFQQANQSEVRFFLNLRLHLKVQSCKLYNSKYMIASTQTTNTEIFAFIAVPVIIILSRKVLFIIRKDNRNC